MNHLWASGKRPALLLLSSVPPVASNGSFMVKTLASADGEPFMSQQPQHSSLIRHARS